MVVVIFRSRIRPDADAAAMEAMGARMYELGSAMPGFVGYKEFAASDGEYLTLVEFEDEAALLAWRDHAEHLQAQRAGRDAFFSDYRIQVCRPVREYAFDREHGRRERT